MKNKLFLLVFLSVLFAVTDIYAGMVYDMGPTKPQIMAQKISSPRTVSARMLTGKAVYYGIIIKTDGSNDITINIYDDNGQYLIPNNFIIKGTDYSKGILFPGGIGIDGLVVNISVAGGGSCSYQVVYDQ
jgi:hypothetical protein